MKSLINWFRNRFYWRHLRSQLCQLVGGHRWYNYSEVPGYDVGVCTRCGIIGYLETGDEDD